MVAGIGEARLHVLPGGARDVYGRSRAAYAEPSTGSLRQARESVSAVVHLQQKLQSLRDELQAFTGEAVQVEAGPSLRSQRLDRSLDPNAPLSEVQAFAETEPGVFYINGVGLDLAPDEDSVHDLVSRINTSPVGVTASYQDQVLKLRFDIHESDEELTLDSAGTGFFEALGLPQGRFRQQRGGANTEPVVQALERAAEELQSFLNNDEITPSAQKQLRERLHEAVASVIGQSNVRDTYTTPYGLRFDLREDTDEVLQLVGGTSSRFRGALAANASQIQQQLSADVPTGNTLGHALGELSRNEDQLTHSYGTGLLVNVKA